MRLTVWQRMAVVMLVEQKIAKESEAMKTDSSLRESEKLQWLADWNALLEKLQLND